MIKLLVRWWRERQWLRVVAWNLYAVRPMPFERSSTLRRRVQDKVDAISRPTKETL